jgi:hypothetical protein
MNTADVREISSTQALFWAIALPVTVTIGGLSLFTAYGGYFFRRQRGKSRYLPQESKELVFLDAKSQGDVEERLVAKWYTRLRFRRQSFSSGSDITSVA